MFLFIILRLRPLTRGSPLPLSLSFLSIYIPAVLTSPRPATSLGPSAGSELHLTFQSRDDQHHIISTCIIPEALSFEANHLGRYTIANYCGVSCHCHPLFQSSLLSSSAGPNSDALGKRGLQDCIRNIPSKDTHVALDAYIWVGSGGPGGWTTRIVSTGQYAIKGEEVWIVGPSEHDSLADHAVLRIASNV